jgi:hypothetical protein
VITRRTKFELNKARDRAHILLGLVIAVTNLDEVVRIIRDRPIPRWRAKRCSPANGRWARSRPISGWSKRSRMMPASAAKAIACRKRRFAPFSTCACTA